MNFSVKLGNDPLNGGLQIEERDTRNALQETLIASLKFDKSILFGLKFLRYKKIVMRKIEKFILP